VGIDTRGVLVGRQRRMEKAFYKGKRVDIDIRGVLMGG
jgi:hypothetical protein